MTADHTPERLSPEEVETICRAGFSAYDHLLQRDPAIAAFEAILAARLADQAARLAAVEALYGGEPPPIWVKETPAVVRVTHRDSRLGCNVTESMLRVDDVRAALHPDPSEATP